MVIVGGRFRAAELSDGSGVRGLTTIIRMSDPIATELLTLTQRLLDCIAERDWATYQELCDPSLTAFEPEAHGCLIEGLAFHQFYFRLGGGRHEHATTINNPHVR